MSDSDGVYSLSEEEEEWEGETGGNVDLKDVIFN